MATDLSVFVYVCGHGVVCDRPYLCSLPWDIVLCMNVHVCVHCLVCVRQSPHPCPCPYLCPCPYPCPFPYPVSVFMFVSILSLRPCCDLFLSIYLPVGSTVLHKALSRTVPSGQYSTSLGSFVTLSLLKEVCTHHPSWHYATANLLVSCHCPF